MSTTFAGVYAGGTKPSDVPVFVLVAMGYVGCAVGSELSKKGYDVRLFTSPLSTVGERQESAAVSVDLSPARLQIVNMCAIASVRNAFARSGAECT